MKLLSKIIEPKTPIPQERRRFSDSDLRSLIIPILIEQFLAMLVGIVDTMMVSYVNEEALSGVSLVNQLNNLFIFVFGALASGGAIVATQYIGKGDKKNGDLAAGQLVMITTAVSLLICLPLSLFADPVLHFFFRSTDPVIIGYARTYLIVTAFSFPFLALYNGCSGLFRGMKRTDVIMKVSVAMNLINAAGNALGIFVFRAGVLGVAVPSLVSRAFAGITLLYLGSDGRNIICIRLKNVFAFSGAMLKRIMRIAIPGAVSSALFNGSKVAISSIVSGFSNAEISAYGIAQDFFSMGSLFCSAMGNIFVVVVGQCMGAGDTDAADYYTKKLMRLTYAGSVSWNLLIIALTPAVLLTYDISPETFRYAVIMVTLHDLFNGLIWPAASALPNGLNASGDVRYTMFASIFSTVICRVFFTFLFGVWLGMGAIGVVLAMIGDWTVKAILIVTRYRSGKWKTCRVI